MKTKNKISVFNVTGAASLAQLLRDAGYAEALAEAHNEWMRRYIENPKEFAADFASVIAFNAATAKGKIPSYGDECVAYLVNILDESPTPKTKQRAPAKKRRAAKR